MRRIPKMLGKTCKVAPQGQQKGRLADRDVVRTQQLVYQLIQEGRHFLPVRFATATNLVRDQPSLARCIATKQVGEQPTERVKALVKAPPD